MKIRKQEYGNCNIVGKNIERIRSEERRVGKECM